MKLLLKFKSGKGAKYENVDDVDIDAIDDYLYVYLDNGHILRCRAHAIKWFVQQYSDGHEYVVYPDKELRRYH